MNWNEIKKNCTKAFKSMCKYFVRGNGGFDMIYGAIPGEIRDLYDFFDEQQIYIEIKLDVVYNTGVEENVLRGFNILIGSLFKGQYKTVDTSHGRYSDRNQAETAAFTKAFEILEGRL